MNELCNFACPIGIATRTNSFVRLFVGMIALVVGPQILVAQSKHAKFSTQRVVPARATLSGSVAGLKIVQLAPDGAAARAGLKYGDVLIAYNNRPITNEDEIESVLKFFQLQFDHTGRPVTADLSLYRDGDMSVKTVRVPIGRLGIDTREWTFAGSFIETAIGNDDYVSAQKYLDQASKSGQYTDDQLLHMRILCVNNDKDGDKIRQSQIDELYQKHSPEKLRLLADYDLLYNKRYRAAVAIFERYLKIDPDVSTELSLASCYVEMENYDGAEALITKVRARSRTDQNAATDFGLAVISSMQARIYLGRRQYDKAQEQFQQMLSENRNEPFANIAFLYCAALRDVSGERPGGFELAYRTISARSEIVFELMGYHIDALRAFVLVKQGHTSQARKIVEKWFASADARKYVPIFWRKFPDGGEIINTWNALMPQQEVAALRRQI